MWEVCKVGKCTVGQSVEKCAVWEEQRSRDAAIQCGDAPTTPSLIATQMLMLMIMEMLMLMLDAAISGGDAPTDNASLSLDATQMLVLMVNLVLMLRQCAAMLVRMLMRDAPTDDASLSLDATQMLMLMEMEIDWGL